MTEYNIYCDESCHLEHDRQPIMVYALYRLTPEEVAIVEGRG